MKLSYTTTSTPHRFDDDMRNAYWYRDSTRDYHPFYLGKILTEEPRPCLHEQCSECGGTGRKKNGLGMCVHMISCPCPKCTPRC